MVREVHEKLDVPEVSEALSVQPFYRFYVSCHGPYVEEFHSFVACFGDDCFYELFSYSFATVIFADYDGFYFGLVALRDQSDEAHDFEIVDGDPELIWSDLF